MIYKDQDSTGAAPRLLNYLRGPGRNPNGILKAPNGRSRFLGGRGFGLPIGTDPADEALAEQMLLANNARLLQASRHKPITKTTLHVTLSWDRGQTPTDADMMDAAKRMSDTIQMGGDNYMLMVYRHSDKDHPHAHVVFSTRNTRTGRAAPSYQRRYRGWHFSVEHDRKMRDERGIAIPKTLQWREDRAQAVKRNDHVELKKLLFKEGISELDGRATVNSATVKTTAVNQAAAFAGKFEEKLDAHRETWVKRNDLIRLRHTPTSPVVAYTTADIYRHESQIIGLANKLKNRTGFAIDDKIIAKVAREMTLSPEQQRELHHSTRDNGFTITIGEAGVGKSHSNIAWRKAHERARFDVRGTSTSNNIVQQMQSDGYRAETIWRVNHQIEAYERALRRRQQQVKAGKTPKKPAPACPWSPKTAWVIEEGFQTSDPDLARFLKHAQRYGCKVKVVMDDAQNPAVERCGTLSVLAAKFGKAELTEGRRNPYEAQTWHAMHRGRKTDWKKAVDDFDRMGSLKWDKSKDDSFSRLVADYMADVRRAPDDPRQAVAMRNVEVDDLNGRIQAAMRAEGRLGAGALLKTKRGPLQVHVGDRVRLTQNSPVPDQKRKGATNGTYGQIEAITAGPNGSYDVVFAAERKAKQQQRKFKLRVGDGDDMLGGLRLGYASTSWGVQGATTGKTFAAQDPMNAKFSTYVSSTRHAQAKGLGIYINESDTENKTQLVEQLSHGDKKSSAHSLMMDDQEWRRLKRMPYANPTAPAYPTRKPPTQQPHLNLFGMGSTPANAQNRNIFGASPPPPNRTPGRPRGLSP